MTEQLTMIDGRDALAVLIVHPHPDDPAKCEAEIHCNGMGKRQFAQVLYRSALTLRDQVLACTCITAVALHSGHCCMAELPDDWQPGDDHCHKAAWDALCDRLSAERGDVDRAPLPGQDPLC